jgi:hypothetical protein
MPAVGSSSSKRRGRSASARDLDAAAIGVGQAIGRLIDARQETLAKPRQNASRLLAQLLLFGFDRGGSPQRQSQFEQWSDQRRCRLDCA